jgi:hypothetical protein
VTVVAEAPAIGWRRRQPKGTWPTRQGKAAVHSGIPKSPPRGRRKAAPGTPSGSNGAPQGAPGEAFARPPGTGGKPDPWAADKPPA